MQAYTALGICNTVINRAESVEGNADDIRVLTAEARCLRGLSFDIDYIFWSDHSLYE